LGFTDIKSNIFQTRWEAVFLRHACRDSSLERMLVYIRSV